MIFLRRVGHRNGPRHEVVCLFFWWANRSWRCVEHSVHEPDIDCVTTTLHFGPPLLASCGMLLAKVSKTEFFPLKIFNWEFRMLFGVERYSTMSGNSLKRTPKISFKLIEEFFVSLFLLGLKFACNHKHISNDKYINHISAALRNSLLLFQREPSENAQREIIIRRFAVWVRNFSGRRANIKRSKSSVAVSVRIREMKRKYGRILDNLECFLESKTRREIVWRFPYRGLTTAYSARLFGVGKMNQMTRKSNSYLQLSFEISKQSYANSTKFDLVSVVCTVL